MRHDTTQIVGLALFGASGVVFLAGALRAGDHTTAVGSVVWLAGCAAWAVPHVRRPRRRERERGALPPVDD